MFHNAISDQLIGLFGAHFYSALTSPTNWSDCLSLHHQLRLGRTRWEFSIIITICGDDSALWDGDLNSRLRGTSLFVRVLWRSNAALRWHQSRRRLHAASQQHAGQIQEFGCITRHWLVIILRRCSSALIDGSRGPRYRLDITRQLMVTHYDLH